MLRTPAWLYRWRCGWLLGHRFLLLTHVGRRTGLRRQTVLEVIEYREERREAVVMSGFGRNSDWLRNIETGSRTEVTIGATGFVAAHHILGDGEAAQVLARYERRNRWAAPVVQMVLSRLAGWRYRGSDDDRRRLVAQLPLVAFRPLGP